MTFTKTEIAKELGIQTYIIALWEKQFGIHASIVNGEPHYSEKDRTLLASIKTLLYEKKYTIDQAKKELNITSEESIIAASGLFGPAKKEKPLINELKSLQKQLIKLREKL